MQLRIDIYHHLGGDSLLGEILKELKKMSTEMDNLVREVAENKDVIASAVTTLQTLAAKIEELKNDPAALQALADDLDKQSGDLAAAIANVPA